jgi:NAD(P)-dependent dehydrogenase (short-subunit alcohol dehydrogenase family)/acyl carrier protein
MRAFPLTGAVAAFRHMAQARHTGKVVLTVEPRPVVRPDATYLVTGGLGALGLAVARWLVAQGAGHLVLLGRGAPTEDTASAVRELGAEVRVVLADVSDRDALAGVLADVATTMPPLRGVVHAAGVLDDGVLATQTWERVAQVLAPKVSGGWHLHELTRDLPLDFFVLFSSAAALLGSAGQGSYVTANTFLDALAEHRDALGLPATSIAWGPWADVGMAATMTGPRRARLAEQGLRPLDAARATALLGSVVAECVVRTGVVSVDWAAHLRQYGDQVPPFLAAFANATASTTAPAPAGVRERLAAVHEGERREVLREHVRAQAVRILGLPATQPLSPRQPLRELGLDSLMAVELRNALGSSAGRALPATVVFDHPTVAKLADYLHDELYPPAAAPAGPAEDQAVDDLLARVSVLDDAEVEALLAAKVDALELRSIDD